VEKLREFEESKENREKVKPFERLGLEYNNIFRKYNNSFEELEAFTEQNTALKKHATGGECIHRGALSPSNTDMIVGGCNRGRLLKRAPKGHFSYEYFFDANGFPICSKKYGNPRIEKAICYETEFLIYEGDTVLGIKFDSNDKRINSISKCLFENGILVKYENAFISAVERYGRSGITMFSRLSQLPELSIEIPRYENGRIISLEWQRFIPPLGLCMNEYNFTINTQGELSTYNVKKLYGYKPDFDYGDNPPEKWVYQVFKPCARRTRFDISQGWV
jgi:hypothetical protein